MRLSEMRAELYWIDYYEIGDVSYGPPAGSLVILYEQNGEIFEQKPVGHIDGYIYFFHGMRDTEITFKKSD